MGEQMLLIPSVPFDRVDNFCSRASIWFATAALRSRISLRCSSSAFFSSMRANSAGDCPLVEALGARIWEDNDRVGYDMISEMLCASFYIAFLPSIAI